MWMALVFLVSSFGLDWGRLSVYRPGDGHNSGELSCGGGFTRSQRHVAYRGWRRAGCGRAVLVITSRGLALTHVRDAGPFGIYRGEAHKPVAWKPWPRKHPPRGWRWRCVADLSWGLWLQLGKPSPLSWVCLLFLPRWLGLDAPLELGLLLDVGAERTQHAELGRRLAQLPDGFSVDAGGLGHGLVVEPELLETPGEELRYSRPFPGFPVVSWHGFLVKRPS